MSDNPADRATVVDDFDFGFVQKDTSFRRISKANMASKIGALLSTPSPAYKVVAKTAAYTATSADGVILVNSSSADVTINLPSAVDWFSANTSRELIVKQTSASNSVFVTRSGSQTIDGATSVELTSRSHVGIVSDGSNWHVIRS